MSVRDPCLHPPWPHPELGLQVCTATPDISLTWVVGPELRSLTGETVKVTITDEILVSKAKISEVRMNLNADWVLQNITEIV